MSPTFLPVMNYLLKGIALIGALAVSVPYLVAEAPEAGPISTVFTPSQLDGETIIWQIAEPAGGQIVVGGTRIGIHQERQFEFFQRPRTQAVRSLLADGDSLWVASLNEIGRFELPLSGSSRYLRLPSTALANAGEIWQIAKSGDSLVAVAKENAWFINPRTNEVRQISLPNRFRLFLVPWKDKLILAQHGVALWEVRGEKLEPFENPLPEKADTFWLWCDSDHILTSKALYSVNHDGFRTLKEIKSLGQAVITSVAAWDKFIAVATYTKGLALVDPSTGTTSFVTRASGLPTLNSTSTFSDKTGRLWVGTTQGLALFESLKYGHRLAAKDYPLSAIRSAGLLISYEDQAEYFHDDGHEERLPRVYAHTSTKTGLALGLWGKVRVGDQEFATPGNKVDYIAEMPSGDLLAAASERLYAIDVATGKSELLKKQIGEVSGITVASNQLWAATFDGTLYRAAPEPPYTFNKVGPLPSGASATLHHLGQTLIVASNDGVRFGEKLAPVAHTLAVRNPRLAQSKNDLWLVADQDGEHRLGRLVQKDGGVSWETVEAKGLAALPDVHYFSANDDTLTFCGGNTILELFASQLKPAYRLDPPSLTFALADENSGTSTTVAALPEKIPAEQNGVTFSAALPFDEFGEHPAYERRLLPTETAWIRTKAGDKVAYPSLSPRDYTLEVRATHLGRTGETRAFRFTVLPPWYQSPGAFVGYAALAALGFYSVYRFRTHQIRKRNLELEAVVQQRTLELAKASAAKTEFLASMSHEIRNPMNGVIGLVNMLREEPSTPRQAHTLKLLHGCAEQLRSTVDDILDFSKIEAGRVVLERTTFDLRDTLEASAATIDPAGRKIHWLEKPPAGLSLSGDAGKLRQIFANYLSNALKYGIPPEARVSTIIVPEDDRVRITLSVTSSGPTIAKDTLDQFFESFTRGTDAMERNIHGTGLGLAICKRYAQAMGGEVGAVSTNGETTFYLNLPFARAGAVAPTTATEAPKSALPAKALAIEDEDYNRIVLGNILAKMNYTVDWATTGAEALQLARENGYDIILTDYRLPDTNGVDLTREILQLCPEPKPAVFAVTAYSTLERREECLRAGMAGFISKPITLEKLRTTLAAWGDKQLTTISLEATRRATQPQTPAAIESGWAELKRATMLDTVRAAELAHRLNNVCRAFNYLDLAEQLELLEGALERNEPAAPFIQACERLLRPNEVDQWS